MEESWKPDSVQGGELQVTVAERRVAWATARRYGLHYPVIPDSRKVIAAQYNAMDAGGEQVVPTWFVVDRNGRVRALQRGALPKQGYAPRTATALGMPGPDAGIPIEKRP